MVAVKSKREVNLTEGPFLKKIALFMLPVMCTSLLQSLYNSADLAVVGKFRGDLALAAVGSTSSLTMLIIALFLGLSVGAGVVLSNNIGANNRAMARRSVHTAMLLSVILGVVTMIIGVSCAPLFLEWMGTPDTIITEATLYMRIIFLGLPGQMLYNYCATMVRATGDATRPLMILSVSGIVNVLLNLFFVAICGMSVEGVALATILSQYFSAIWITIYMYNSEGSLQFRFKELCIDPLIAKRILQIGIPSGLQSTLFSVSNVLIQSSVNSLGDAAVAGNAAATNIDGKVYMACNSGYHAAIAFVGQNMGAKKYENIRKITLEAILCVTVIGVVLSGLVLLFPEPLLRIFTSEDAEVITAGLDRLYMTIPLYFLCGVMEVLCGVLRGMGKSIHSMVISLITCCFFRVVWVNTVFLLAPNMRTIYIVYPITWVLAIIAYAVFIVHQTNKLTNKPIEPVLN